MGRRKPAVALSPHISGGGEVSQTPEGWQLSIPPGAALKYRLAQVDDYHHLPRKEFPWRPPVRLQLRARVSDRAVPGTWGFGLWNDPFSLSLGLGGGTRRFPALPNAAWFFYASEENHLAWRESLPANGFLAATFRSPTIPTLPLASLTPLLPLLFLKPVSRLARRLANRLLLQDACSLDVDVTSWHEYTLTWEIHQVTFHLDGERVWQTPISPRPPLGLVIWIDNQYAAWRPDGTLAYSTLETSSPCTLEVESPVMMI